MFVLRREAVQYLHNGCCNCAQCSSADWSLPSAVPKLVEACMGLVDQDGCIFRVMVMNGLLYSLLMHVHVTAIVTLYTCYMHHSME